MLAVSVTAGSAMVVAILVGGWALMFAPLAALLAQRQGRDALMGAAIGLLTGPIGLLVLWAGSRPEMRTGAAGDDDPSTVDPRHGDEIFRADFGDFRGR